MKSLWQSLCLLWMLLAGSSVASAADLYSAPPGRLVNVGTHSMYIYCSGEPSGQMPTVILESGLGGLSLEWWQLQKQLSRRLRVCSYDRSGYGWSQTSFRPRISSHLVDELKELLHAAAVPPPYVIVAHSFGAYNALYFTNLYPDQVAGLVLLDASHPQQVQRLPDVMIQRRKRIRSLPLQVVSWLHNPDALDVYPLAIRPTILTLLTQRKSIRTQQREFIGFVRSAGEAELAALYLPERLPLAVVSRGRRVWEQTPLGDARERSWKEMQAELAALTQNSLHVLADHSGHMVHLEQSDQVRDAVFWVIRVGLIDTLGEHSEP